MGYHLLEIKRGVYGEVSKIIEEIDEAIDAKSQCNPIMLLVELSDLCGAMRAVARKVDVVEKRVIEPLPMNAYTSIQWLKVIRDDFTKSVDLADTLNTTVQHLINFLKFNHPSITILDLSAMANATERAFQSGARTPKE